MCRPITFAIDEIPHTLSVGFAPEYTSRMVSCALRQPLFQRRGRSAFEASNIDWTVDKNELAHSFRLHPKTRWSNGAPVTAEHYIHTFRKVACDPYWGRQFRFVDRLVVLSANEFRIDLRQPMAHLPALLASVELSPSYQDSRGCDTLVTNGPYALASEITGSSLTLEPNPHIPGHSARDSLRFVVYRDLDLALHDFQQHKLEVTCATAFPYDRIVLFRHQPNFHAVDTGIFMQLEFNALSDPSLGCDSFRRARIRD